MPEETSSKTFAGLDVNTLGKAGTVVILLAIMFFLFQAYTAKDTAYIALANSISQNTSRVDQLGGQVGTLSDEVTNLRISIARMASNSGTLPTPSP